MKPLTPSRHSEPPTEQATSATSTGHSPIVVRKVERPDTLVDSMARLANANQDDWNSEQSSGLAESQLKRLAKLISDGQLDDEHLSPVLSPELKINRQTETPWARVFQDSLFQIHRALTTKSEVQATDAHGSSIAPGTESLLPGASSPAASKLTANGYEAFRGLINQWNSALTHTTSPRVTFKVFRVEERPTGFATRAYLEIVREQDSRSLQQNLELACEWTSAKNSAQITAITIVDYSQAAVESTQGKLFVDCTRTVMGTNSAYEQQVVPGIPYWARRIGREVMGQFGHHGLAIGDVNGDGLDDIYACDTGGLPNRLYIQQADGTVRDASSGSGVDILEDSLGALLIDIDNDGDQDLAVVSDPYIHFAENLNDGRFRLRSKIALETDGYSLCAADFDHDKDLDIYVCGYNARRQDAVGRGLPFPLPYHDANNGGRNYLLRNDGTFQMVDVTSKVGLDVDNQRFSLAAAWEDYDNDGDQDLYVANDFGRNCLYRNDQGKFVNVAAQAGVEDQASGMSVTWGDYDRDGWMDLYVSNMFSAAGNRVAFQRRFADGLSDETTARVQRMARGNTLFRNRGDGTFEDTSVAAGVTQGRWAWGSRFVDINGDGWQDLVVANGYITNEDTGDL